MSDFLHAREYLHRGDIAVLDCNTQCNFFLVDDNNFSNYKNGRDFRYFGNHYKMFPARIIVPETGNWNVILDLGGGSANIKYSISYIKH